ncbi:MAG: 23S rRNA (pseudouridine(1915)-N(3))-methyltransferase RlmH [Bacteroidales bacterium]
MEIVLLLNGKTEENYLQEGIQLFEQRIGRYIRYESKIVPALKNAKNMPIAQQKEKEAELMEKYIEKADFIVLLDERGTEYGSKEFANFLQKQMNKGIRTLMFVVGGPYGFSESIYAKAQEKISLSRMTFSHQMIRLLFTEQLYRGFSILKGEPYHNE